MIDFTFLFASNMTLKNTIWEVRFRLTFEARKNPFHTRTNSENMLPTPNMCFRVFIAPKPIPILAFFPIRTVGPEPNHTFMGHCHMFPK